MKGMRKVPAYQNGHREPMEPNEEFQQQNSNFNYFEEEEYADEQDYYQQPQQQKEGKYYQDGRVYNQEDYQNNGQRYDQQPVYSPRLDVEEEPPSLSPRLEAPEGMDDRTPIMSHQDSLAREQLGYPLGEEGYEEESAVGGDDAALDLAELEQLQEEAERMKGLGNKHMAAQEYTRAYNAYSAALQLSPVGPSSHVFLSNRAASLLSLKRYSAAAVDARRAVALAPTFGKGHARLGQALYFLKQYQGAIEAYEDALRYEEEESGNNVAVTRAYLVKAKEKLALQEEKERRRALANGDDAVTVGEESAFQTVAYSVVTDKEGKGVASGMMNSQRLNEVAKDEKDKQMSSINEDKEVGNAALRRSPLSPYDEPAKRSSPTIMYVETGPMGGPAQRRVEPPQDRGITIETDNQTGNDNGDEPDPDFEEALRLQRRATQFLSHKKYRQAVDDFSAALFLVPDDPVLTPQLHVGRAHALNGQERFESAKSDALMALRHILRNGEEDVSAAEAYSVLGKSLYYTKDYHGAVEALEECDRVWKLNGGKLSVFDEAYLEQCHEALDAGLGADQDGASVGGGVSVISNGVKSVVSTLKEGKPLTNIPKLKPPRFVSREEALQNPHNIPPMPKNWPMQSPTSPSSIATGPERAVTFLSDAMGIKLNRGNDGLIRVISVADLPPGSPILRKGKIETGDLVREAGGVDLRRPITATMWGDTVALIKMAPRPLTIIVAKEMTSELNSPRFSQQKFDFSSAVIGEESVADWKEGNEHVIPKSSGKEPVESMAGTSSDAECAGQNKNGAEDEVGEAGENGKAEASTEAREEKTSKSTKIVDDEDQTPPPISSVPNQENKNTCVVKWPDEGEAVLSVPLSDSAAANVKNTETSRQPSGKGRELSTSPPSKDAHVAEEDTVNNAHTTSKTDTPGSTLLNKEILFDDSLVSIRALNDGSNGCNEKQQGWTNRRWAEVQPTLLFSGRVFRMRHEKKLFWCTENYAERTLAIFKITAPHSTSPGSDVILILRHPTDNDEVARLAPINKEKQFFVAESVIDPMTCKLRLSQLTMPTSIPLDYSTTRKLDGRKQPIFDLLTPIGPISLSAVQISEKGKQQYEHVSYEIDVIVETARLEDAISNALFSAHSLVDGLEDSFRAGTHQVVQGTLHSYVISGNDKMLQVALSVALQSQRSLASKAQETVMLDSSIVDARDLNWKTPLHYACERGRSSTISLLISAGANCAIPTHDGLTPLHICAQSLSDKCISIILSATCPARPDPDALDSLGRTPMYLASTQGNDAAALNRCLSALSAWGANFLPVQKADDIKELLHPIHFLSAQWKHNHLGIVLAYSSHQFPLMNSELGGISLGAKYGYPIHAAIVSLRHQIHSFTSGDCEDASLASTIKTLVEHGFEPNERLEGIVGGNNEANHLSQYFGFTPLQILTAAAKELKSKYAQNVDGSETMDSSVEESKILEIIRSASDALIRSGARMNLPPPPASRLDRETPAGCVSLREYLELCNDADPPMIDRTGLKFDDDTIISMLGGKERVKASMKTFSVLSTATSGALNAQLDISSVADSNEAGGSDSSCCAICWGEFGVISNRKQFCQVSTRYVCNDCSSKRLIDAGKSIRVSDGQFLLAKAQEGKQDANKRLNQQAPPPPAVAVKPEHDRDVKNRVSLGLLSKLSSSTSDTKNEKSTHDKISSAVSGLHQTRDAVLERGSKLKGLADKTEALSQASIDFANLAKELNQQQNSWW